MVLHCSRIPTGASLERDAHETRKKIISWPAMVKQIQTVLTPKVHRRNDSPGVPISGTQKCTRCSVIHDVYVQWWQTKHSTYLRGATPKTRRTGNGKPSVITACGPEEHRGSPRVLAETFVGSPRVIRKKYVHDSDAPREAQRVILTAFGGRRVYCPLPFLRLESVPARRPRFEATY